MNDEKTTVWELPRPLTKTMGLLPHLLSLIKAIGPFGLEPRVREIMALAIARSGDCRSAVLIHRLIGRAAGLTDEELAGSLDGLTAAELSAVALGLGTVGRALPKGLSAAPPDEHFTFDQIQQLEAVALAVGLDCQLFGRRRG